MLTESDRELFERIKRFASKQVPYPLDKVRLETRLGEDLGLAGDDARDFFSAFSREFGVDLANLDVESRFGSEGWDFAALWPRIKEYFGIERRRIVEPAPVTVADLIEAARSRTWKG